VVRTVRVRLELDRDSFKQGLRDSAASMRTFDGEVKTLGKDAERTGVELKDTGAKAKQLGDDVKRSSREVTNLGRDLETARGKLRDLGDEYKRSGNVELQHYKSLTGEVRKLERARRDLDKLGGQDQGQGLLGGVLGQGLSSVSGLAPTGIVQWLVGAAVLAAPAMGAAISAGVLLGVGGGTLAGGIIAAAKDPAVKGAFTSLGTEVAGDLGRASQVFVRPLVDSADIFRAAWADVGPQISHDFDMVAPAITHLSAGVAGFAHNVMPGFNASVAASVPLLNQLGDDTLPRMGSAIGQFFQAISQGGPGAQAFFRDLTTGADLSVKQLGGVTLALTKMYDVMRSGGQGDNIFEKMSHSATSAVLGGTFNAWTTGLEKLDGGAKKAGDSVKRLKEAADASTADAIGRIGFQAGFTGDELSKLSGKISATALSTDSLAGKMSDKLLGSMMSLDQATLGFAQSQNQLIDATSRNGTELDIATDKGQANRQAILGVVAANIRNYDALIQAGAGADFAAAQYDDNTRSLEEQLRQAHFTQGAIDDLIGKYRGVPATVDTDIKTYGLQEAINSLDDAIRLANNLDGRVSVITIEERHRITYSADTPPSQFFKGLAHGGVVSYAQGGVHDYKMSLRPDYTARSGLLKPSNPGTILAGEPSTGGEVFGPRLGVSHERGLQLAGVLAGWHGGMVVRAGPMGTGGGTASVTNVNVTVNAGMGADGMAVGRQIAEVLRPYIRSSGGGNVQVALGKRGA
jgi:hypothetical protein